MYRFLGLILIAMFLPLAQAGELQPRVFNDQWDKEQTLNAQTQVVIYSNHKAGSAWVKQALQDLNITDLDARHWLYVANISKMPKMITKMFAIPKMRDYEFPVALVREDDVVKDWPVKENAVAVYLLENLDFKSVQYFDDAKSLEAFLQTR